MQQLFEKQGDALSGAYYKALRGGTLEQIPFAFTLLLPLDVTIQREQQRKCKRNLL